MVKVKICGITNADDALASINAGCDAIGFAFFKKSPRYITAEKASLLIRQLPGKVIKIGVFADAKENTVKRIARLCKLDMLQFHGHESPAFCNKFKGYKVIKAFRIKDKVDLKEILKYKTFAYLFDAFSATKLGGTGRKFDWNLLTGNTGNLRACIFLSGGLNPKNVNKAIRTVHSDWVDASSSLEVKPGQKDHKKVKDFIKNAKRACL